MSYPNAHKGLYAKLLGACDYRLQALEMARNKNVDVLNEQDEKTAKWLYQAGFDSVEEMLLNMIWTLQFDLGLEDCEDMLDYFYINMRANDDGYLMPFIAVFADYKDPGIYGVRGGVHKYYKLPKSVSEKCFGALPKTKQDYLKSIDYDNLTPEEDYDIYKSGNYDAVIEINSDGDISYYSRY